MDDPTNKTGSPFQWTIREYVNLMTKLDRIEMAGERIEKLIQTIEDHEQRIITLENVRRESSWFENAQLVKAVVAFLTVVTAGVAAWLAIRGII